LTLYILEIALAQAFQRLTVVLYAIGRQMTVLVAENPYLYAKSRNGSLFNVRASKPVDSLTQKVTVVRKYEIKDDQASLKTMILNCLRYLLCCGQLKSSFHKEVKAGMDMRLW